ncbi:MAG TPA: toll/interleukin-1 receptor domain-containing protein, partial [Nitrososphaera sp.]
MATSATNELKIFYFYAHEDQHIRKQLEQHLSNLKRLYHLQTWFYREILPGENWETVIEQNLNTADLILLLISPAFMASDYCYNTEMQRALERHANQEAKVIPILVRRVHWTNASFSHLQLLPTDAKPVKSWIDQDEAFYPTFRSLEKHFLAYGYMHVFSVLQEMHVRKIQISGIFVRNTYLPIFVE